MGARFMGTLKVLLLLELNITTAWQRESLVTLIARNVSPNSYG